MLSTFRETFNRKTQPIANQNNPEKNNNKNFEPFKPEEELIVSCGENPSDYTEKQLLQIRSLLNQGMSQKEILNIVNKKEAEEEENKTNLYEKISKEIGWLNDEELIFIEIINELNLSEYIRSEKDIEDIIRSMFSNFGIFLKNIKENIMKNPSPDSDIYQATEKMKLNLIKKIDELMTAKIKSRNQKEKQLNTKKI